MSGLPEIPNLDPTAVTSDRLTERSADTDKQPDMSLATPAVSAQPSARVGDKSSGPPASELTQAAPRPISGPAATTPASDDSVIELAEAEPISVPIPVPMSLDGYEDTAPRGDPLLRESIDEVLEQTTDHRVRLTRVEEVLELLGASVGDIRDEMHAGFIQISSALPGPATSAADGAAGYGLAAKLDDLATQSDAAERSRARLTKVVWFQVLLLLAMLGLLLAGPSGQALWNLRSSTEAGQSADGELSDSDVTDAERRDALAEPKATDPAGIDSKAIDPKGADAKTTKRKRRRH